MLVERPSSTSERALAGAPRLEAHPRELLRWAVLAPSRHNTQPWIFDVEGDEVRVHADHARALPVADPDGRQLVMACGAAAANLRVAAAHHGRATSVEVPGGVRGDGLLARVRMEERCSPSDEAEALFAAIPRRRTNRLPLDGREPPEGLLGALAREARREGVFLEPVEAHQRAAVAEIVAEGDRRQWSDPRFRAEMSAWARTNGSARRDGLFGWSLGLGDAAALLEPWRLRFAERGPDEAERDRRRALGTRTLVVLSTRGDDPPAWFAAGEALERVLLHATAAGLSASFFSAALERPDLRRALVAAVGMPGKPQALFRLGYGLDLRAPPRRPLGEVERRMEPTRTPPRIRALALREPHRGSVPG
jgi:hypothetical protein